eukprot:g5413.t1
MATHLHIGQCGAQAGLGFWDLASKHYEPSVSSSPASGPLPTLNERCPQLFHAKGNCRAVWIDTEPKVLAEVMKKRYATGEQISYEQSGRGNNFALGYTGSNTICAHAEDQVRREAEQCDRFQGVILWHSLGGGTGSGVGTKLATTLRDSYGKGNILTISVLPDLDTDSPLLSYNAMFSMACLSDVVDAQLLFQNSKVSDLMVDAMGRVNGYGLKNRNISVSNSNFQMKDINSYIARTLSDVLFPTPAADDFYTSHLSATRRRPFDLGSFVSTLCPIWDLKLVNVYSSCPAIARKRPTDSREWRNVVDNLVNIIPKFDDNRKRVKALSTYIYLRKKKHVVKLQRKSKQRHKSSFNNTKSDKLRKEILDDKVTKGLLKKLSNVCKYSSWYGDHGALKFHNVSRSLERPASGENASIAVCSNSSKNIPTLKRLNYNCKNMLDAKAYVHWYTKFGLELSDFEQGIARIDRIADIYSTWCV